LGGRLGNKIALGPRKAERHQSKGFLRVLSKKRVGKKSHLVAQGNQHPKKRWGEKQTRRKKIGRGEGATGKKGRVSRWGNEPGLLEKSGAKGFFNKAMKTCLGHPCQNYPKTQGRERFMWT